MAQSALLTTEQANSASENLDLMTAKQIVQIINKEDHNVVIGVEKVIHDLSQSVDIIADRLNKGGRLFIFGAGTSGRLGVMNAVGITEKYHLSADQIVGVIAGGDRALRFSVENSEDNREQATKDLMELKPTRDDIVFGISAGGGAPYILQVLEDAQKLGIHTIGYSSNTTAKLKSFSNTFINPVVGPEVLTGSSRMKSGSAQEMTLLAILEAAMVKISKIKAIHKKETLQILQDIVASFKTAAPAVKSCATQVTKAVQMISDSLNKGGRLFYFGTGTSGREGVLDASECWPTFGVEHGVVNGYVMGGDAALRQLVSYTQKRAVLAAKKDFESDKKLPNGSVRIGTSEYDVVMVLENNPYALAALEEAKKRGLKTIAFSTTKEGSKNEADVLINPVVDDIAAPIVTKFVLNTLTTASMALIGKVIGNKMVDVAVMNSKLVDRAIRIVSDFTGKSYDEAQDLLRQIQVYRKLQKQDPNRHVVPVAIVMAKTNLSAKDADMLLIRNNGLVRRALADQEKVNKKNSRFCIKHNKGCEI